MRISGDTLLKELIDPYVRHIDWLDGNYGNHVPVCKLSVMATIKSIDEKEELIKEPQKLKFCSTAYYNGYSSFAMTEMIIKTKELKVLRDEGLYGRMMYDTIETIKRKIRNYVFQIADRTSLFTLSDIQTIDITVYDGRGKEVVNLSCE